MAIENLFGREMAVVNIGVRPFGEAVREQGVPTLQVRFRPPQDAKLDDRLDALRLDEDIRRANAAALEQLQAGEAHWIGMERAMDAVPDMKPNLILHAGPPIAWERMLPVQQGGILGGALHEGLAKTPEEARAKVESGEIEIGSANDHFCVGAGAGIITPRMIVNICEDRATGLQGYCIPFEGRNGLGAWGLYNEEVERNLRVIEEQFAPAVDAVLKRSGGINVRRIVARGMEMGDESHTRQLACSQILTNEIMRLMLDSPLPLETIRLCMDMFLSTERWFHPLGMAGSMACIRGIKGKKGCSFVTTICQNGVETGLKVAGMGETWYLAPAPRFTGQYFSTQWGPEDAVPYMGDSTVTEVMGLGGFAAAAAPSVLRLRGGGYREAIAQTERLKKICAGTNPHYPLPLLDFTGPGLGIDILKVADTGIAPICHGGIISKAGGQIGAGAAEFPLSLYLEAARDFARTYAGEGA